MLIEFRAENHRSIRDEQVLTLEASKLGEGLDSRLRFAGGAEKPLLPVAVLYGPNASGKSNVLSAFFFMREAVLLSQTAWQPDIGVPRVPFGWGPKRNEPSTFEVSFLAEGTRFQYGFVVNDNAVEEEWLYAWPHKRKQEWFTREANEFKFGASLGGQNEVMKQVTRPNALFLSVANQHGHAQLSPVFSWFRDIIPVNVHARGARSASRLQYEWAPRDWPGRFADEFFSGKKESDAVRASVRRLIEAVNAGIVDAKILRDDEESSRRPAGRDRLRLKHKADDEDSWLDLDEESRGTKTLFEMAVPIYRSLARGNVLLVDELESSLHPLLGLAIVRMFNSPETNPNNAQILFTTHDTNLLGTTLGEPPLRRDQIWFAERDGEGATELYPLTDYKPRNSENLERGYLQGRYGAIPFLGDITQLTK